MRGKDLGEHLDLFRIQILGVIQGLVERLCVVGVKPHWVCLFVKLSYGRAVVRLGGIQEELREVPTNPLMRFHSI